MKRIPQTLLSTGARLHIGGSFSGLNNEGCGPVFIPLGPIKRRFVYPYAVSFSFLPFRYLYATIHLLKTAFAKKPKAPV